MATNEQTIRDLAEQLGERLKLKSMTLATAESCTGGWMAKIITDIPRSSQWFEGSAVCYSNDAKHRLLGVPVETLEEFGAVSGETVSSMIGGIFEKTSADVAVSVSGIAGPGGGTDIKPVGTVWIGCGKRGKGSLAREFHFKGDREAIRLQAVEASLNAVLDLLD